MGEKLAIVSDKPQTTRHKIQGSRTIGETQMIFLDTPGIHRPGHRLNERMMAEVYESLRVVDLLVQVVDASQNYGKGEEFVLNMVRKVGKPTLLVLNKVDLINKVKVLPSMEFYGQQYDYREMIPLSAVTGDNIDVLEEKIAENLPERAFLYPPDFITDQTERVAVSELIREKVLVHTRRELPYSTAVLVEEFDESEREKGFVRITASIIVEREGQKKIVIGRGGQLVKTIGMEARPEIQELLGVPKVYLELQVRLVPGWRDREHLLDELGVRSDFYTGDRLETSEE